LGNSLFSDQQLDRLTAASLGQTMDFAQLEMVAVAIANHYRAAGYVVQARLPAQDIVNGVVTIEITEATFGKVRLDGPNSKRFDVARIEQTIYQFQPSGSKFNANNIDRALAALSDLAGIRVQGQLLQGAESGQTDFIVSTQDWTVVNIDSSVDNSGARSTGQERLAMSLTLNSPLRMGDQLSANAMVTKGSDYFRTAYRWPMGYAGWTLGLNASQLNYKVTDTAFSALPLQGSANAYGLESTYPLAWRSRYKLTSVLGWDVKNYINQRDAQVVTSYDTRAVNVGLQGHFLDPWGVGGFTTWQVVATGGELTRKIDTADSLNAGRYDKIKYTLNSSRELTTRLSFQATLNGQTSQSNLDSSEKLYLGGLTGVRAYPSSEGGGSKGQLLNLELRHKLNNNNTWFVFYDHGQVAVNPSSIDALNTYVYKGYGMGYGHVSDKGINLKALVATRLGQNPNPTSTGQDQDGSLITNRFWFSASLPL
jgi:hemolysin activation/secretion protein